VKIILNYTVIQINKCKKRENIFSFNENRKKKKYKNIFLEKIHLDALQKLMYI